MPKYYLLGGENTLRRDAAEVNQRAFMDAGGAPRVLVFSWARASFDRTYQKRKLLFNYFRTLGASTVNAVDYSTAQNEIKERLGEADLVYLTGGVPSILLERLKKSGIDRHLGAFGGVIVGRSAGALALCSKCIVTGRNSKTVSVIDGLGFVEIALKAHYRLGIDEALKVLSKEMDIFAVPKGSAIVYDNGDLSFLNAVYLFRNGERRLLSQA